MWFIYLLSYFAVLVQVSFFTICIAAGLYYVADLVEEHTVVAKKIITWIIMFVLSIYVGIILFEDMPLSLTFCGVFAQLEYLLVMKTFPVVEMSSPPFIMAIVLLVINHYLAFSHFGSVFYPFVEVLGFFTICLWVVPFALFVSLSANDNILPIHSETTSLLGDDDVVTNYFSKRGRKYGLLSFFNYAKDSILPQRSKKSF